MTPLLEMKGVVAGYRGGGDVLQGVDLTIEKGSITCIVGPNGAGKSTVLRVMSGLLSPRQGEVRLAGESIGGLSPAAIIARGVVQVPQSDALFADMTVRENVMMGAFTLRRDRATIKQRYRAVQEQFPIVAERAEDKAGNLSGGQRRAVEFARSLMLEPQLVLLDEPSVGLDPKMLRVAHESVKQLASAGRTVVLIEQNVRFGLSLATRGVVMEGGRQRLQGPANEVLDNPEMADLYFGGSTHGAAEAAGREAKA